MVHKIILINDNLLMITVLFSMLDFTQPCSGCIIHYNPSNGCCQYLFDASIQKCNKIRSLKLKRQKQLVDTITHLFFVQAHLFYSIL